MNAKRRRVSHVVLVARIRVETALVEIEGDDRDDEEAERQAIEKAESLPDDVWVMQPFDESAYRARWRSPSRMMCARRACAPRRCSGTEGLHP
jgi:hypothetical protein